MKTMDKYFDANGRLTLEGIAVYAEAVKLGKVTTLPNNFQEYILSVPQAAQEVLEIYDLLVDEEIDASFFPFDKMATSTYSLPTTNEGLDAFLADILRKALEEESVPNKRLERRMLETVKGDASNLKVLTPQQNEICIDKIHFTFNKQVGEEVYLTFFNQEDDEIEEVELAVGVKETSVALNETDYPSGLYYWMLDNDGDIQTGRFYVCQPQDAERILQGMG